MRKPRADSLRNRERLLEAAKAGFTEVGPEVSLEEIARRAEVGIGTLYRHFPTRDAVVEAVYRREVDQLTEAAGRLSESLGAAEALHAWMRLFIDYIATKKLVVPALGVVTGGTSELFAATGQKFTQAITALVSRGVEAGEIRSDVEPYDILRAVGAFAYGASGPGWEASALRLVDIFMDGLRA